MPYINLGLSQFFDYFNLIIFYLPILNQDIIINKLNLVLIKLTFF